MKKMIRWTEFKIYLKKHPNYTIKSGIFSTDTDYYYNGNHIATSRTNDIQDEYWIYK